LTTQHPAELVGWTQARRTVHIGRDEVEVTRLAHAPFMQRAGLDDETRFVSAFRDATSTGTLPAHPPESLSRAFARASIIDPEVATTRIRNGIVTDLTDSADISVLRSAFSPLTVLPGEQPRGGAAGGRPGQVREPGEGSDAHAARLGLRVLAFDDTDHLRDWCADALTRSLTRAHKRGRPEEIAATGVRRPVAAYMALLQFDDGTASQWVPMLSDGISRLAVCAAGLLGLLDQDPTSAAETVARHLLPVHTLTPTSSAHELARRMRRNHQTSLDTYARHLDEDGVDEDGVRMRQFMTLPVDLHLLAVDAVTGEAHPMEPAMESVVSDCHTGVDGWAHEDDSRHCALRAIKRLVRAGLLGQDLFDLCANRADLETSTLLRQPPSPGLDAPHDHTSHDAEVDPVDRDKLLLRRAVTVMSTLLGPATYPGLKSALRATSGLPRLTLNQVVDFVAPLVCEPWGTMKPITRAWAYGGPVPTWIRETSLRPVHPADYLALVAIALDPRVSEADTTAARLELALAGGTALLADGVLTTALVGGSGSASTPLPFRGSVSAAVDALTGTEEGLTALAVAANHFRPSRSARSARLPALDLDRPDKVARDGVGVPVRITETILAEYAARAMDSDEPTSMPEAVASTQPTPLQNLQARARHLPADTRALLRDVELTKTLHDETGGPSGLSEHDLDTVHDALSRALKLAGRLT
jgi:hypothetical protein